MTNLKSTTLLIAALALLGPAVSSAQAGALDDHYRAQFKQRMCANHHTTAAERDDLVLNADEEVTDIGANSEEIESIFVELQNEFDNDQATFCQ